MQAQNTEREMTLSIKPVSSMFKKVMFRVFKLEKADKYTKFRSFIKRLKAKPIECLLDNQPRSFLT